MKTDTVIIVFTIAFVFRKQFWSPISIPNLISGHLMARLQLPPPMEPANSLAHHHWQLLLVLPPMASAINNTSIDWLKSVLSGAPPPLATCMGTVELLSLSDDHKTKVIVKVLHTCILVIVLLEYIYIMIQNTLIVQSDYCFTVNDTFFYAVTARSFAFCGARGVCVILKRNISNINVLCGDSPSEYIAMAVISYTCMQRLKLARKCII